MLLLWWQMPGVYRWINHLMELSAFVRVLLAWLVMMKGINKYFVKLIAY